MPADPMPHASADARPADAEVVSVVIGDRLCAQCGYNLTGQTVTREPHYKLLVARCPECGTVAALQEYPSLGRWANRWAVLLAGLWFLVSIAFWFGNAGVILGFSIATADEGSADYSAVIREDFNAWADAQAPPPSASGASAAGSASNTPSPSLPSLPSLPPTTPGATRVIQTGSGTTVTISTPGPGRSGRRVTTADFRKYWPTADRQALLAQSGGWWGAVNWLALVFWIPLTIIVFLFGCFWAVSMLGMSRQRLMIWSLAIISLALMLGCIPLYDWLVDDPAWSSSAAQNQLGPGLLLLTMAYAIVPLILGMMLGRNLIRRLVCVFLPPRLRYSLAMLWTADGLLPPGRGGRASS